MRFKKNKVWLAIDRSGDPVVKNGKVLIKYQLDQEHKYWVHQNNVKPLDDKAVTDVSHNDEDVENEKSFSTRCLACTPILLRRSGSAMS